MTSGEGVLLSDDLIFTSRVTGTAQALGGRVRVARDLAGLLLLTAERVPACAILDPDLDGLTVADAVRDLRSAGIRTIVGYGSHVHVETLRAARAAGIDPVLPRSAFVQELPTSLKHWLAL